MRTGSVNNVNDGEFYWCPIFGTHRRKKPGTAQRIQKRRPTSEWIEVQQPAVETGDCWPAVGCGFVFFDGTNTQQAGLAAKLVS